MKSLQVAVPCPKKWDELIGNESRRFCNQCQKHVHNLTMSSPIETKQITLQVEAGERVCVAYFQTPTGAIQYRPTILRRCLTGLQSFLAILLPLGTTSLHANPPTQSSEHRGARLSSEGEIVMGDVAAPPKATPSPTPKATPPIIRGEAIASPTVGMIVGKIKAASSPTPSSKP